MSEQFKREERYVVIKLKTRRQVECVVVESDWPEYEIVWKMIQDRVEGRPNELTSLRNEKALGLFHPWKKELEDEISRLAAELRATKEKEPK